MENKESKVYKVLLTVAAVLAVIGLAIFNWQYFTAPTEQEEHFVDYMYSNGFAIIEKDELIEMGKMTCETLEVSQVEQMLEALTIRGGYAVEDSITLIIGSTLLLCPEYEYKLQQYIDYGEVY